MAASVRGRWQKLFGKLRIKIAVTTALFAWPGMAVVYLLSIDEAIEIKKAANQKHLLDVVTVAAEGPSGD